MGNVNSRTRFGKLEIKRSVNMAYWYDSPLRFIPTGSLRWISTSGKRRKKISVERSIQKSNR